MSRHKKGSCCHLGIHCRFGACLSVVSDRTNIYINIHRYICFFINKQK